jgi:hypothetical protein
MENWEAEIEQVIQTLGTSFDTHKAIQALAHCNQRKYVAALAKIDGDTPFHQLHSSLGRSIKVVCERLGFTGQESRSLDLFGQHSKCILWSRK